MIKICREKERDKNVDQETYLYTYNESYPDTKTDLQREKEIETRIDQETYI